MQRRRSLLPWRRRSGTSTVELAIIAPVLFLTLFAIIEFGYLFFCRAKVQEAASEACRLAISPGFEVGSPGEADIIEMIETILAQIGVDEASDYTYTRDPAFQSDPPEDDPNEVITVSVPLFGTHGVALPGYVLQIFFPADATVSGTVTMRHG
ncbi:MAG: hypothetical protein HJJLKODD_01005 [Phycisphaerae bacterium]|nr:hypothetical protein [Phycisphaerae bacterium]